MKYFGRKLTSWVSALNNEDFLAWATLFTSLLGDQIATNHLFGKDFGIFWWVNNFDTTWSCSYLEPFKPLIRLPGKSFQLHWYKIRAFPWRPATPFFLKYPLPRPPANTWAFTTQSGVGSFFAISNASSAEWATWPSGVFTPYSFFRIKLWSFDSNYVHTLRRPKERYSWIERFLWQVLTTARRNPPNIFPNLKNIILPVVNSYLTGN